MSVEYKNAPDEPSAAALPKMVDADESISTTPFTVTAFLELVAAFSHDQGTLTSLC